MTIDNLTEWMKNCPYWSDNIVDLQVPGAYWKLRFSYCDLNYMDIGHFNGFLDLRIDDRPEHSEHFADKGAFMAVLKDLLQRAQMAADEAAKKTTVKTLDRKEQLFKQAQRSSHDTGCRGVWPDYDID